MLKNFSILHKIEEAVPVYYMINYGATNKIKTAFR